MNAVEMMILAICVAVVCGFIVSALGFTVPAGIVIGAILAMVFALTATLS